MNKSIFDFKDYKAFLNEWLLSQPNSGRGIRGKLGEAVGCQLSFVSQVLQGEAHFNLEHGERISQFLQHSEEETNFLLLLIQYARAGTENLRKHLKRQIEKVLEHRLTLKNRMSHEGEELSLEDRMRYYSSWHYGAIRVACSVPALRTKEALRKKLSLPIKQLNEALEFLLEKGILVLEGDQYIRTRRFMHLGNDSALITKHHTNWRIKAMQHFDREGENDVHYSAVVSLSKEDLKKLKTMCVDYISGLEKTIKASKEETLASVCLDFYEI